MEFTSSSSSGGNSTGVNIGDDNDMIDIDDTKDCRTVLPTKDEEIDREHLVGHNRAKAIGEIYNAYGGPSLSAMSVETLKPGHLIMETEKTSQLGKSSSVDSQTKKLNVKDLAISQVDIDRSDVQMQMRVPRRPYLVLPCNFITTKSAEDVISLTKELFENGFASVINYEYIDQETTVDYEYIDYECGFNGVYIRGSKFCDFKLRIFEDTSGLLVEMQRLHKDSCGFTFKKIFEAIKTKLLKSTISPTTIASEELMNNDFSSADFSSADLSAASQLTDEEITSSIQQVLSMMEDPSEQSQLESCRILCDLSEENEIRKQMIDNGCVELLAKVLSKNDKEQLVHQHSVFALAQLSECHDCDQAIVACGAIPHLLSLVDNGTYKTAAMRRECARIIANVAMKNARLICDSVSREDINAWSSKIASIKDPTIKERSERAFSFISCLL